MPLPFGIPGSEDLPDWLRGAQYQTPTQALDPNEIAALRQRNAVRPPLGRQEGPATQFVEETFGLPRTPLDAGLMALGGPFGKGTKALALGLGGLLSSGGEAEAGPLAMVRKAIRAYHGSPHDFERFDLSKIGTGEGAQAYGHGLYFAENPAVAKEYRDVLTRRPVNDAGIDPAVAGGAVFDIAEKAGDLINGKIPFGPTRSLLTRDQIVSGFQQGKYSPFDLSPTMQRQIVDQIKPPGRMYEVNINADPAHFLDWDKPLMEQHPNVLNTVADIAAANRVPLGNSVTGEAAYRRLDVAGDPNRRVINPSKEAATAALREGGIPGIKYLDQGSRLATDDATRLIKDVQRRIAYADEIGASPVAKQKLADELAGYQNKIGSATSNYVLFRDDIIDILRKYGLAGLAPAGGLALSVPSGDQAEAAGLGPLWHGISKVKLPRPIAEMTATHVPTSPITEKTIAPEALQGGLLLPAWGDRSMAGTSLTEVGGQKLATPVEMQGGHGFMPANVDAGVAWASGKPVIGRLAKQTQELAASGKPVYFPYTAMGERSIDFSHHVSDTLTEMLKGKSVPTKTVADFNTGMRTADVNFPAIEDWPGLRSPKLKEYLAAASGDVRNKFAKLMDTREFQAGGMPSVAEARFAITDPSLLDVPTGAAGRSIARLDPEGRVVAAPTTPHRTYSTQLGGQYVGGLPLSIPKEVMYPDMVAALEKMGYPAFRNDYLMQRGVTGAPIAQRADQQWVDRISKYLETKARQEQ